MVDSTCEGAYKCSKATEKKMAIRRIRMKNAQSKQISQLRLVASLPLSSICCTCCFSHIFFRGVIGFRANVIDLVSERKRFTSMCFLQKLFFVFVFAAASWHFHMVTRAAIEIFSTFLPIDFGTFYCCVIGDLFYEANYVLMVYNC